MAGLLIEQGVRLLSSGVGRKGTHREHRTTNQTEFPPSRASFILLHGVFDFQRERGVQRVFPSGTSLCKFNQPNVFLGSKGRI